MDLGELYQETLLDHNKNPRNFRVIDPATHRAEGHNPLCGDKVTVFLEMDGDTIRDVSFQGAGCAISTASASMLTQVLKGKTRAVKSSGVRPRMYIPFIQSSLSRLNTAPVLPIRSSENSSISSCRLMISVLSSRLQPMSERKLSIVSGR